MMMANPKNDVETIITGAKVWGAICRIRMRASAAPSARLAVTNSIDLMESATDRTTLAVIGTWMTAMAMMTFC